MIQKLPTDYLFKIIKSLTKAEKRHIKLQLTQNQSSNLASYILLFDLTNKQDIYNEALLLKSWKKQFSPKHLPKIKYKLYNKILQSLTTLHKGRNVYFELRGLIDSIEMLYEKQLYAQCNQQVVKVLQLAATHQCLIYEFEAIQWQKKLCQHLPLSNKEAYHSLQIKGNQLQKAFGVEMQLKEVLSELVFLRQTGSPLSDMYEEKVRYWMNCDDLPTKLSKLLLYEVTGVFFQLNQDFKVAFLNFDEALKLWDAALINLHRDMYDRHLLQWSLCAFASNKKINNQQLLAYIQQAQSSDMSTLRWLTVGFNTLCLGVQVIDNQCNEGVQKFQEHINNHTANTYVFGVGVFHYAIALHYFAQARYREAVSMLHQVFGNTSTHLFFTTLDFAYILKLICHYELGDIELFDHLYRKILHIRRKNDSNNLLEYKLLSHIKQLYQTGQQELEMVYQEIEKTVNLHSSQSLEVILLNAWITNKKQEKLMIT